MSGSGRDKLPDFLFVPLGPEVEAASSSQGGGKGGTSKLSKTTNSSSELISVTTKSSGLQRRGCQLKF